MEGILYTNGHIFTHFSPVKKVAEMLVREGRVRATGERSGELPRANCRIVDLQGEALMPGFCDAHIHIWKVGDLLTYMLDLRGIGSREEMLERIADFARERPSNAWILARGFNEAQWADGLMPTRHDLDRVVPDRPVQVIRTCAHIAVLNTCALKRCSISADTPVPSGGEIRLDPHGQPNGILTETALGLVKKQLPEPGAAAYRDMVLAAQDALLKTGITAATDPAVHPELMAVYREMERNGELRIRINAIPILVPDGAAEALPLPERYESDYLTVNTVKLFSDGGLSGKTAALHRPYLGGRNELGVLRLEREFFLRVALQAQEAGWRIATHAIGDRAIDLVCEVYAALDKTNNKGLRHRIEHLGLPSPQNLRQMAAMGTHAVTQPVFIHELGPNFRQYLPEDYLDRVYPFKSMFEAGLNVAFSSDAPVVRNFTPWQSIATAQQRLDQYGRAMSTANLAEAVNVYQCLHAFTAAAALANDQADCYGSLEVGKLADIQGFSLKNLSL
jgi:predicted amidohydrolase YtcJ